EPGGLAQHGEVVHRDDRRQPGLAQGPPEGRAVEDVRTGRARLLGEAQAVPTQNLLERVALLAERSALLPLAPAELDQLDVATRAQRVAQPDREPSGACARLRQAGDVERDLHSGHG